MRFAFVILAVAAQIAALAVMAGQREYVLANGEVVHLRTAPIDPRDIFRGDYVSLNYEAAWIASEMWQGDGEAKRIPSGEKVYAALGRDAGGLAVVESLGEAPPETGPYIAGRVIGAFVPRQRHGVIQVKYGIERYFVQQGRGLEIEARRGDRDEVQVPMEVAVALGPGGVSVIKDYRWSRLGVLLEVVRAPERQRQDGTVADPGAPLSPKLRVTLKNVSDAPLAVADPGPHCGFELLGVRHWARQTYEPVDRGCAVAGVGAEDVHVLQPGESYAAEIDLSEPEWYVTAGGKTDEVGKLAQWDRFRLVYNAPDPARLAMPELAGKLWLGSLPSRAFNAAGFVD